MSSDYNGHKSKYTFTACLTHCLVSVVHNLCLIPVFESPTILLPLSSFLVDKMNCI